MVTTVASVAIIFILLAILSPESIMVKMPVFQSDISFGLAQVPIGVMFLTLCGLCTSVMGAEFSTFPLKVSVNTQLPHQVSSW